MDRSIPGDENRLASDRRLRTAAELTPTLPGRGELRLLLLVAALMLGPFIGFAVWARQDEQAEWELGLLSALLAPSGLVGTFSTVVNTIGNLPLWAGVIAIATLAMLYSRGRRAAVLTALSFPSDVAAFFVKVMVERERPETAVVESIIGADSSAFPSGHTVRAAALIAVVIWLLAPPRMRVPVAVLGALVAGIVMGYARVSLGVHWPTDTIGGTLLGICWFALTTALVYGLLAVAQPRQQLDGAQR